MNALEIKEMLVQYSDKELKTMKVRVLCNMDCDEGDLILVDSFDSYDTQIVLNI